MGALSSSQALVLFVSWLSSASSTQEPLQAAVVISICKLASFSIVVQFGNHLQVITTSCLAVSPCTMQAGDRNNYRYQKPILLCKMKKKERNHQQHHQQNSHCPLFSLVAIKIKLNTVHDFWMNIRSFQNSSCLNFAKFPFVFWDLASAVECSAATAAFSYLEVTFRQKSKQWVYVEEGAGGTGMACKENDGEIREGL